MPGTAKMGCLGYCQQQGLGFLVLTVCSRFITAMGSSVLRPVLQVS